MTYLIYIKMFKILLSGINSTIANPLKNHSHGLYTNEETHVD